MVRIAVVGTGGMANHHASNFKKIAGCRLVACCDIDRDRAVEYARRHGIPEANAFGDLHEMLKSADFDAVTNVTSDAAHCPTTLPCIAAGKPVLCEKPLAVNYADAKKMADAARRKGVINMVNFSYRNSSAIHRAAKLVADGAIGRLMHFDANYLQCWLSSKVWGDWHTKPAWLWRLSTRHGSKGVLGDIGVHILDFASYPAGEIACVDCRLKTFDKAKGGRIGEYILDANDSCVMHVELANGALGVIHTTRWATGYKNTLQLRLFGDKGAIRIDLDKSYNELEICRGKDVDKAEWKTMKCPQTPSIYQRFINSIRTGKNDPSDFARGAQIQKVIDACFESDKKGRPVTI